MPGETRCSSPGDKYGYWRKALNEVAKTRIDLEVKDFKGRNDIIGKIMGEVLLEDMTKVSRERAEKYTKELAEGQNPAIIMAVTLDRAREIGDWLFSSLSMFEKQEQEKDYTCRR